MAFATVDGRQIEYRMIPGEAQPTLVFLHEGLGSVALWRDFPDKVAARLGLRTLIYSRFGYGQSDGLLAERTPRYMHEEALSVLPALLDQLGIERPLLVGHSDGASISIIHAAAAERPVSGLALLAPHVFMEEMNLAAIARTRETYGTGPLKGRLARYHANVDDAFLGWADIWLDPAFRSWNIEGLVGSLEAPMLLIQGLDDEYGTLEQLDRIEARARVPTRRIELAACGHSPHRDQEGATADAIVDFAKEVRRTERRRP